MAVKKVEDLAVVTGTYSDGNGGTKNRYQTVGSVMEKDDGSKFILLERWFNPAGLPNPENRSSVIISRFPAKDQNAQSTSSPRSSSPHNRGQDAGRKPQLPDDDSIPF